MGASLRVWVVGLLVAEAAAQSTCSPERCSGSTPRCPISTGIFSSKIAPTLAAAQPEVKRSPLTAHDPPSQGVHCGLTRRVRGAQNVYFRNAAPFPADIIRVDEQGHEVSQ